MSLLSTASNWVNDDTHNKKRTPMMRKSLKTKEIPNVSSYVQKTDEYQEYQISDNKNDFVMHSITDVQQDTVKREERVNQILNQMNAVSAENDGGYLADFKPPDRPEYPSVNKTNMSKEADAEIPSLSNELMPQQNQSNISYKTTYDPYMVQRMNGQDLSNYHMVYDPVSVRHKPYYSKMGISDSGSNRNPDKLLERINYMIHLLENQEHEKTANITEEFILYSFLGIFVIFVLDSFSRTAKYTR